MSTWSSLKKKLRKFKKFAICLAVPSLSCVMWDLLLQCVDPSCGAQAPECAGSAAAALEFIFSVAWGILVPRPGIKLVFPALEGGLLSPCMVFFLNT